jgi:DMSO reductase family type II enzyme heme b subunit
MNYRQVPRNTLFLAVFVLLLLLGATVFSAQDAFKPPHWVGIYSTAGKVGLKWDPVPGAVKYKLYRTVTSGKSRELLATTTDVSYIDAAVKQGETYYYSLKAVSEDGRESGFSDERYIKVPVTGGGLPVRPRDFNTGLFRGGHTGRDLYLRIHNGLAGTPMIPYGDDVLKPAERWALVHYVQSLRRTDISVNDLLAPEDNAIRVRRVAELPTDPMDAFWDSLDPVRVPLNPLWPEPNQVYAVAVSAVTDGQKLAVLLQWRDELPQNTAIRVQDFQDAAALQFSLTGNYGFLGMGDAQNPVNLWQWKAGWQMEANGDIPEMRDTYQAMHVDTYFQPERQFATATSAGNVLSQPHKSPIEDANARGFGSFTSQPLAQQNVAGKGLWHAGFWNVIFIRDLKSKDKDDVQFAGGRPVPVAFAIWNGGQGDRNGRKMVSNWYQLILDGGKGRTAKR